MKSLLAYRHPSKLSRWLALIISLTMMLIWLPLLRSVLDGDSYQWGLNYFGISFKGTGMSADYWFLLVQLLLYAALLISMYRIQQRWVYYLLLALWFVHVFGNFIADILINGDTIFYGDTLGIRISLTWIVIPLSLLTLSLILAEIHADAQLNRVEIPWSNKNRLWLYLLLGLLPIQAILLASGKPHGTTDQIGVVLTIVQCLLLPRIVRPYGP